MQYKHFLRISPFPSQNKKNFSAFGFYFLQGIKEAGSSDPASIRQIGICQSDIISITAVATITTASIMLTNVNAFFENLFCLYSPQVKQRVSAENIITTKYNQVIQSHSFVKLELNKIAARWPAKAVAQFSTFSKKGSDRIVPRQYC